MNFHWPLFRKPEPLPHVVMDMPMRGGDGQFSASPKTMAQRSRRASVNTQLGVYVALTPADIRKAETEAFIQRRRSALASFGARAGRGQ